MIRSKALEVNIADYHVDVEIDPRYVVLQEIMSKYYGIMDGFNTFLKELSHPYKNWKFIIQEARGYGLNYFHLFAGHPRGTEGCALMVDIYIDAIDANPSREETAEAVDNLIVYLQKMAKDAGERLDRFLPVIDATFERIHQYPDEVFFLFVKSYYQLNRVVETLCTADAAVGTRCRSILPVMARYLNSTYTYWLNEQDPGHWFAGKIDGDGAAEGFAAVFADISHDHIADLKRRLKAASDAPDAGAGSVLAELSTLPGFSQIVTCYRDVPQRLMAQRSDPGQGRHLKLIFLFHMINTAGLAVIHEELLREINRTVSWLIRHENYRNIEKLIRKTFSILKDRAEEFPATALNCVPTWAKGSTRPMKRSGQYLHRSVIELGFQIPAKSPVSAMTGRSRPTRPTCSISAPGSASSN
jgi:pyruvate,orthophosphate dikinase